MTATPIAPYRVEAYNTLPQSENKIHDDATARRFGFSGALVPGVDVYGYMTHVPVMRWGRDWLERGTADCRFIKPVYDGEQVVVSAVESPAGLAISVESRGELCASGMAGLPERSPSLPDDADFRALPEAARRPPADETSLACGTELGVAPLAVTPDFAARYLADLRETAGLYAEAQLVHPGTILRMCNWALSRNVVLGPWIHVGSRVQHIAAARIGETLSLRARVTANYEHKGHSFVELDCLALAAAATGDGRPVARIAHTAIYRPRQVLAA